MEDSHYEAFQEIPGKRSGPALMIRKNRTPWKADKKTRVEISGIAVTIR